jgi:hypothetical protein
VLRDGAKPGLAVLLAQRDAGGHLLAIRLGVKRVGVVERQAELLGDEPPDAGLADARDAHDDDQHRPLGCSPWPGICTPWCA